MAAADETGNKKHFWKPCSFCFYSCGKMCKKYLKNSIVSSAKVVFLYFFIKKNYNHSSICPLAQNKTSSPTYILAETSQTFTYYTTTPASVEPLPL